MSKDKAFRLNFTKIFFIITRLTMIIKSIYSSNQALGRIFYFISKRIFITTVILFLGNHYIEAQKSHGDQLYHCPEIGWTIDIPEGFKITVQNEMAKMEDHQPAQELIEKAHGQRSDVTGMKYLVFFQKDQVNTFQSTLEKRNFKNYEEWKKNVPNDYQFLLKTYETQGLNIDTLTKTSLIGHLEFDVLEIIIKNSKNQPVMKQECFGTFVNGYEFGVALTYNSDKTKAVLTKAWTNSKFAKK